MMPLDSPYQTKQATGKALKCLSKALPNSPRKKQFVLAKIAKEAGLDVKGLPCKVCNLRPAVVKRFDQISHSVCICMYHENVRLVILGVGKQTNLSSSFSVFASQVTCDDQSKKCVYRQCDNCKELLETFKGQSVNKISTVAVEKKVEKVSITTSVLVRDIFEDLN